MFFSCLSFSIECAPPPDRNWMVEALRRSEGNDDKPVKKLICLMVLSTKFPHSRDPLLLPFSCFTTGSPLGLLIPKWSISRTGVGYGLDGLRKERNKKKCRERKENPLTSLVRPRSTLPLRCGHHLFLLLSTFFFFCFFLCLFVCSSCIININHFRRYLIGLELDINYLEEGLVQK